MQESSCCVLFKGEKSEKWSRVPSASKVCWPPLGRLLSLQPIVISETRTCQSSILPCLDMAYFGRQTKVQIKWTRTVGKNNKNLPKIQKFRPKCNHFAIFVFLSKIAPMDYKGCHKNVLHKKSSLGCSRDIILFQDHTVPPLGLILP